MEAYRNDREQTEPAYLHADADQGNSLASVQLADGIGVRGLRPGYDDGSDQLSEQGEDVEADEYRRDPAC